jgi:transcriptional regulator with XRE-family HTH domain
MSIRQISLGSEIREVRKSKGFSLRVLGELAGIEPGLICRYENNQSKPRVESLRKLSEALEHDFTPFMDAGIEIEPRDLEEAYAKIEQLQDEIAMLKRFIKSIVKEW